VQVAAGGLDVAVAQQAADGVQVDAGFEQVRGEAVAQGVGAAALVDVVSVATEYSPYRAIQISPV